jgi:hypothetical protein
MRMQLRLPALAILLSFAAVARTQQRAFQVGAVVVASAGVTSAYKSGGPGGGIEVRLSGRRAPPAAVLVGGEVRVVPGEASIIVSPAGPGAVTVLY